MRCLEARSGPGRLRELDLHMCLPALGTASWLPVLHSLRKLMRTSVFRLGVRGLLPALPDMRPLTALQQLSLCSSRIQFESDAAHLPTSITWLHVFDASARQLPHQVRGCVQCEFRARTGAPNQPGR